VLPQHEVGEVDVQQHVAHGHVHPQPAAALPVL
jgi:hypothetical protein